MCRKQGKKNGGWESMQVGSGRGCSSGMLGMQVGRVLGMQVGRRYMQVGEGSWSTTWRAEGEEKRRKEKWVGLLHWASVWASKWRWKVGQVGLKLGLG